MNSTSHGNRRRNSTKVLASAALVAAAAGIAGLGTFGAFTSSVDAAQQVDGGTIELTATGTGEVVTAADSGISTFTFDQISGMLVGDTADRALTLHRGAESEKFGSLTVETTTTAGSTALRDAMEMTVTLCDEAPTATNVADPKNLNCSGTALMPSGSILNGEFTIPAGYPVVAQLNDDDKRVAHLLVTYTLPETVVDNTLQGQSLELSYSFTATQRSGKAL